MTPLLPHLWMACTAPSLPAPVVTGVDPGFAWNAADAPITIVGEEFWPAVTLDAGNGAPKVDRTYRAWLVGPDGGRDELVGVGILDRQHLSATVPAGFATGAYELVVEGPTGARGALDGTFVVTDEQAARIDLRTASPTYPVTQYAPVDIQLLDLAQELVELPFDVVVTATGEPGVTVEMLRGTLDVTAPVDGGLAGRLVSGFATVHVRPSVPGLVHVTVAPGDAASVVSGETHEIRFDPGDDRRVRIDLPAGGTEFVAGEAFLVTAEVVDLYGNDVQDRVTVAFATSCSDWFAPNVTLEGPTLVTVVPETACVGDTVTILSGPEGSSPPFDVVAGSADHFGLLGLFPDSIDAGTRVTVVVEPRDAFGNLAEWLGDLAVADTPGGLVDTECGPTGTGYYVCETHPTIASPTDVIVVTADGGLVGETTPFEVQPDDDAVDATVTVVGPAIAGEPVAVEVRGLDAWGNVMLAEDLALATIAITDDLGEATCVPTGSLADALTYDCTLFDARPDATLVVELPDEGVLVTTTPFLVVNGPLAVVYFLGEAPVVAGVDLPLALLAEDAHGNRYLTQADPVVDLADDGGSWSVPSVTLEADGTADAVGSFTLAGATQVRASQAGRELGASATIVVSPAAASGLALTPQGPWAWRDVPIDVQVEVVDPFGNRTSEGGAATIASTTTASPVVPLTLVNGVGTAPYTWVSSTFTDVLEGTMGAFTGTVDVVIARDCGASGPTPVLTFGGYPEAIACVDAGTGAAPIVADLSASVQGNAAILGYAAAVDGGPTVADTQALLDLELPGTGAHALHGLAVQVNGCGTEVAATGWAGPDDDTPVGPIPLSTAAADLPVSTVLAGPAAIDVGPVVDCSRDPAALQEVHLRTTAGLLTGPAPTGAGLAVVLDATGAATVDLATNGGLSEGAVEIHAWVESGAAGGLLALPLTGDAIRPVVTAQDPAGVTGAFVDEVTVTFSEPMLAGNLTALANWSITGPAPASIVSITDLGDAALVTLDAPVDGAAGLWTITASSLVRDEAGNRLAGDWGIGASTWVGAFGGAGGPPADLACAAFAPAGLAIRPDGDDGDDAEADALVVTVSSAVAPAWWVVEVTDGTAALVHLDWEVPMGPVDTVSWSGRGLDGTVVPNGAYTFAATPDDGLGNRGDGCVVTVTVDNRAGATP